MDRRRTSPTRRVITGALAAACVVMGGATPLVAPTSVQAMEIGPGSIPAGGLFGATIACNAQYNQVRVRLSAAVQTGYFQGQYIAFRFYVKDGRTASWTPWAQRLVAYDGYRPADLFDQTSVVADGGYYEVYAQLQYWNGSSWAGLTGMWSQRFQAGYFYVGTEGFCVT
jgi:hypothetical protein